MEKRDDASSTMSSHFYWEVSEGLLNLISPMFHSLFSIASALRLFPFIPNFCDIFCLQLLKNVIFLHPLQCYKPNHCAMWKQPSLNYCYPVITGKSQDNRMQLICSFYCYECNNNFENSSDNKQFLMIYPSPRIKTHGVSSFFNTDHCISQFSRKQNTVLVSDLYICVNNCFIPFTKTNATL
jgi:hypothetical protein